MAATTASRDTDPFSVRALARGLSILCLFDVDHREWTIDEMVERTGLVRMTAYRMVRTLESMAFLVRDSATNRYRLGPAMLALCYVAADQSEFIAAARPFLESLVEQTGESVTLAVEVDGFPVCVDIINTTRPFKRQTAPGRILGDIATVHGKIFTAFKSPEEREALLARPRARRTPQTVTDREVILAELDRVVKDGVAYDLEGYYQGLCAVGAPVRDQFGAVTASISVVAPAGRFGPAESAAFAEAVTEAAGAFSAYLGWTPRAST
ncbi:MAG: IclR family transcriptional regulator [Actinobacteria bacterium]|jgi:DNA-binding IclR family transcriptional regulator|nr:IclR family transcriptional regulator [Actinomycetota bacterium]